MTRFSRLFLLSTLTLAFGAVACGDGDGGGPSSGKKLSSLSESQAIKLCNEINGANADLIEQQCALTGLYSEAAGAEGSCEETRDECIAELTVDCEADVALEGVGSCDATVGELRKCYRDQLAQYEKAFEGLSCESDLESFEETTDEALAGFPESCNVLVEKCPEEFGDDEQEFSSKGIRRFAPRARK